MHLVPLCFQILREECHFAWKTYLKMNYSKDSNYKLLTIIKVQLIDPLRITMNILLNRSCGSPENQPFVFKLLEECDIKRLTITLLSNFSSTFFLDSGFAERANWNHLNTIVYSLSLFINYELHYVNIFYSLVCRLVSIGD